MASSKGTTEPTASPEASACTIEPGSLLEEVVQSIRDQPLGEHRVADLAMPLEFLVGVADRLIRATFEERFRIVVGEDPTTSPDAAPESASREQVIQGAPQYRICDSGLPDAAKARWASFHEERPGLRGFMAPTGAEAGTEPPRALTDPDALLARAATIAGARLAFDGLLHTLAQIIEALGAADFIADSVKSDPDSSLRRLLRTGLPLDLLAHFRCRGSDAGSIVSQIARWVHSEGVAAARQRIDSDIAFEWRPSEAGFAACTESGEGTIRAVRVQLTRGDDWIGPGDGGNIDLVRQLAGMLPDVSWIATIQQRHLKSFCATSENWPWHPDRVSVIAQDLAVSQWAQDNGKAGMLVGALAADPILATIVPRYASRGEDGSTFVPGDALAAVGLEHAGHQVVRSPLLFQGGNMLVVTDPKRGDRMLVMGEAELHRNVALGLTLGQVLAGFAAEFGVDRVEVLPAASFHIDTDVSIRACKTKLIAFVNDPIAAAWIMVECALPAMQDAGLIDVALRGLAGAAIRRRDIWAYINAAGGRIFGSANESGHFPLSLAEQFSSGPTDPGVGNLHRVLAAMDLLMALAMSPDQLPQDRVARGYLESLQRMIRAQMSLRRKLEQAGMEVVPVPGWSNGTRGVSAINGLQIRGRYLMPVYGGMLEPLDRAAERILRRNMEPGTEIKPVRCGESQRRAGALHCSVAAWSVPILD